MTSDFVSHGLVICGNQHTSIDVTMVPTPQYMKLMSFITFMYTRPEVHPFGQSVDTQLIQINYNNLFILHVKMNDSIIRGL